MKQIFLLLLSLMACGSQLGFSGGSSQPGNPPPIIQGTHSFGDSNINAFLLQVYYPCASDSYFTYPQVLNTCECPVSGSVQSTGSLDIQADSWTGTITHTFQSCVIDEHTTINEGSLEITFSEQNYSGSGAITINKTSCETSLSGDWSIDTWDFCELVKIKANL